MSEATATHREIIDLAEQIIEKARAAQVAIEALRARNATRNPEEK